MNRVIEILLAAVMILVTLHIIQYNLNSENDRQIIKNQLTTIENQHTIIRNQQKMMSRLGILQ